MLFLAIPLAICAVFLLPDAASAWGPATHLELAQAVLENTSRIEPLVRTLVVKYPFDFLYGNISADIVVGKNLVEELKHCHNWQVGFKVLRRAETDSQQAFAYGYLSHLAADTVAHNHFIPEMMIRSYSTRTLRHLYWEMRFDALADKGVWKLPKKIVREVHQGNDRLLGSVIEDTPLSFRTNKTIFSSFMSLHRFDRWHRMLDILSSNSRWTLHRAEKDRYFNISLDTVLAFLKDTHGAACLKKDPTGKHSLNAASFMRKRLQSVRRNGHDVDAALENAVRWVRL